MSSNDNDNQPQEEEEDDYGSGPNWTEEEIMQYGDEEQAANAENYPDDNEFGPDTPPPEPEEDK